MKGTRPLDNNEIRLVSACFTGNPYEVRNRGLFMLGVSTGGRISELLSLKSLSFLVNLRNCFSYLERNSTQRLLKDDAPINSLKG